jgi:hypothetical protein
MSATNTTTCSFRSLFKVKINLIRNIFTFSFRYIENLKPDNQFISDWPKQLKASMNNTTNTNNGHHPSRTLPSNWFLNGSPGLYNNVHEALWSMRDNMWSDVIRIRNVLSDEW